MRQLASVLLAMILLPVLMRRRMDFGLAMLLTGVVVGVSGGLGLESILSAFFNVFTGRATLQAIVVLALVSILCGLLKEYGIVDRIGTALKTLFRSKKALIMALPAVMGIMQVPGGAAISAPFANSIGAELNLTPPVRSVVNLSFRHIAMLILPFSAGMLMVQSMVPQVSIYRLILLNLLFVVIMETVAYFLFLRKVSGMSPRAGTREERGKALRDLLIYFSPIYLIVVFNIAFGMPLYLSVSLCIFVTFLLSDRTDFLKKTAKSFNFKVVVMMVGIYFFRNIIGTFDQMLLIFSGIFSASNVFVVLLFIALSASAFGLITGLSLVPMSLLLPLVATLPFEGGEMLIYVFFLYAWSFLGYYYSPVHLCLVLSNQCIGCSLGSTFRKNLPMIPVLILSSFLIFFGYSFMYL
jgi:hypothetical protein